MGASVSPVKPVADRWRSPSRRTHSAAFATRRLLALLPLYLAATAAAAPDRFARLACPVQRLYTGQVFELVLSIHYSGMPLDKAVSLSEMASPGIAKMETFQELPMTQEAIEGRLYDIRRFRARATAGPPGSHLLSPNLQGTLIEEVRSYFFVQRHLRPVSIPVEPFSVTVLPLPRENRPESFSGAVGEFRFQAAATPLNVAPGDLVTIEVHIEGLGLPDTLPVPAVPAVAGLKVYEMRPIPSESTDVLRVFRQTVVPGDPSLPEIPALAFTFFNIRSGQYETQSAGPFRLAFHAEPVAVQPVYTPARTTNQPLHPPAVAPEGRQGFWNRWISRLRGETVELLHLAEATDVRVAPGQESAILFRLRPGTVVRITSRWEGWLRIEATEGIGWIRAGGQ